MGNIFGFIGGGGGSGPTPPPTDPIDNIQIVDAASTTPLPAFVYDNGVDGVGATITAVVNGVIPTMDGVTLTTDMRILYKDATNQIHNGIYEVTDIGSVGTPFILTRLATFDEPNELNNSAAFVVGGDTQKDFTYYQVTDTPTIGVDNIVYELQTTQAITVAKYTTSNTVYVDRNSNFATNTRVSGDKYNRDKPFLTLQAAINASAVGDTIEILSNITENVTVGDRTLLLNNCILDSLITGTGNVTIRGTGNCQLITDFTQTAVGSRTLTIEYIGLVRAKTSSLGIGQMAITANYCYFADSKQLLVGGFSQRASLSARNCNFLFDSDYIFDNNNVAITSGFCVNTKAGGSIKRNVVSANATTTQEFYHCRLISNGTTITGRSASGGTAGTQFFAKWCLISSAASKNVDGSALVEVEFCTLIAAAGQAENITVPAGSHFAYFNRSNLAEIGTNIVNKDFNKVA